ncbi:MAG: DUF2142 domain-containing protein [Oscillospiraceae bacterium]|nr:DUF2142 domain-containing protein [Oscillospiraceae bacterium]
MDKFKKVFKYICTFTIPAVVCFLMFCLVWFQYLQDVPSKSQSWLLNDSYDSLSSPMEEGQVFTQDFTVQGPVNGFGLNINRIDNTLDGTLYVQMIDNETGEIVMDYQNNLGVINPISYTGFTLDTPLTDYKEYDLTIKVWTDYLTPEVSAGQMLTLKKSSAVMDGFGIFSENGKEAGGSLAMLIISDVVGNQPVKFFFIVAVVCSILAGIILLLVTAFPKKKVLAVFLTLLTTASLYRAVLPVYSAPDEETHYNTAYNLSNKWLGIENDLYRVVAKRQCDTKSVFTDYHTSVFTYRYMMNHFSDSADDAYAIVYEECDYLFGYKLPYMLSAAGITLGRITGMGGVATAFMARFMNILVFCVMMTAAWCLAPFAKMGFIALAMLPITIHVGTSVSYDSFIIAFGFATTAMCLHCMFSKEKLSNYKLIALAVLCVLSAPLKSAYLLIPAFILGIPNDRFSTKKTALIYKVIVLVLSFGHFGYYNLSMVRSVLGLTAPVVEVAPVIEETVTAAAAAIESTIPVVAVPEVVPTFTIGYMLAHPGVLLKMVINTFFTYFTYYFETMIGGRLGYLHLAEIEINPMILIGFAVAVLFGFIANKEELPVLNIWQRLLALAIFGGTLGILVAGCITWTPMDYDYIWGFQGRYLLPVLPLALLAGQTKNISATKDISSFILYALFSLNVFTILNTFIVIFSR